MNDETGTHRRGPAAGEADNKPRSAPPAEAVSEMTTGARVLALVLAGALVFACVVMVTKAIDLGGTPLEEDCIPPPQGTCTAERYYEGSSASKAAEVVFAWASAAFAALAALVGLYFAYTGLRSRLLLQLTAAAIALGAISVLIGALA